MASPSTKNQQLRSIQLLRGVAALAVVFHHSCLCFWKNGKNDSFLAHCTTVREFGACGVDIFFVISGFIMVAITANKPQSQRSPGTFLIHRFIRVAPLYWIYTTALLCLMLLPFAFATMRKSYTFDYILRSYLFIPAPNYFGYLHPALDQGWTLSYEMFFYLLFSLCLRLATKQAILIITAVFVGLSSLHAFVPPSAHVAFFFTDPIILEFCLGMFAGWVFTLPFVLNTKWLFVALFASFGALTVSFVMHPAMDYRAFHWGLPAFGLVASLSLLDKAQAITKWNKLLLSAGDSSYSIYLTHIFLLLLIGMLLKKFPLSAPFADVALILTFGATLIPGFLSYLFVEKPLTRLLNQYVKAKTDLPQTNQTAALENAVTPP